MTADNYRRSLVVEILSQAELDDWQTKRNLRQNWSCDTLNCGRCDYCPNVLCKDTTLHQSIEQPVMAASSARGHLDFPCPRTRLRIWSRGTGSAVPSRVSPLSLHTQAESDWLVLHGVLSFFPICVTTVRCSSIPSTAIIDRVDLDFIGPYSCVSMASTAESAPAQGQ